MKVLGLFWLGVRTTQHDETVDFFRDVMHFGVLDTEQDFTVLEVADRSTVEIFGPTSRYNQHLSHPVAGFVIEDIDQAAAELAHVGCEIVLPVVRTEHRAWLHFRAPDGFVYGVTQVW